MCIRDSGHSGRAIDVLKVDIEGAEYTSFEHAALFGDCLRSRQLGTPVDMLLVELHGNHGDAGAGSRDQVLAPPLKFFRQATACGLALFSKDLSSGPEFGFVSARLAFREYVASHPSCSV